MQWSFLTTQYTRGGVALQHVRAAFSCVWIGCDFVLATCLCRSSLPRVSQYVKQEILSPLLGAATRLCSKNRSVYPPSNSLAKLREPFCCAELLECFQNPGKHKISKTDSLPMFNINLPMFSIISEYLKEDITLIRKKKTNKGRLCGAGEIHTRAR